MYAPACTRRWPSDSGADPPSRRPAASISWITAAPQRRTQELLAWALTGFTRAGWRQRAWEKTVAGRTKPGPLTRASVSRYTQHMAQSFLIFDFGPNEEAAQQARHKVDGWKQAFRLDKKLLLKFDREEPEKPGSDNGAIRLIVRLDFSDHERLSHQRWLDRIPAEEPFKDAHPKVIRQGDAEFTTTAGRFDALDFHERRQDRSGF